VRWPPLYRDRNVTRTGPVWGILAWPFAPTADSGCGTGQGTARADGSGVRIKTTLAKFNYKRTVTFHLAEPWPQALRPT
jgi:hypothetical protein